MIIVHRINKLCQLDELSSKYGLEFDVREGPNNSIKISHDLFEDGEDFENYINVIKSNFFVINVKSDGLEEVIIEKMEKHAIENYVFLDSSLPTIIRLTSKGFRKFMIRQSEFEPLEQLLKFQGLCEWVWLDSFYSKPPSLETVKFIRNLGFDICLVSPELQQNESMLGTYLNAKIFGPNLIETICTKSANITAWENILK